MARAALPILLAVTLAATIATALPSGLRSMPPRTLLSKACSDAAEGASILKPGMPSPSLNTLQGSGVASQKGLPGLVPGPYNAANKHLRGGGCPFPMIPKGHLKFWTIPPILSSGAFAVYSPRAWLREMGLVIASTPSFDRTPTFPLLAITMERDKAIMDVILHNAGSCLMAISALYSILFYHISPSKAPDMKTFAMGMGAFNSVMSAGLIQQGWFQAAKLQRAGLLKSPPKFWGVVFAIFAVLSFSGIAVEASAWIVSLMFVLHEGISIFKPEMIKQAYQDQKLPLNLLSGLESVHCQKTWVARYSGMIQFSVATSIITLLLAGSIAQSVGAGFLICGLELAYCSDAMTLGSRRSHFILTTMTFASFYFAMSALHSN